MNTISRSGVVRAAIAFAVVVIGAIAVACSDSSSGVPTCGEIPTGGCPPPGDCTDPTCTALYTCDDGAWVFHGACAPRPDAGPADAGADAAPLAPIDASIKYDGAYDMTPGANGGGENCEDLEMPDCTLGTGAACAEGTGTCCDCQDLFVCQSDGWVAWGSCDGGVIIPDMR